MEFIEWKFSSKPTVFRSIKENLDKDIQSWKRLSGIPPEEEIIILSNDTPVVEPQIKEQDDEGTIGTISADDSDSTSSDESDEYEAVQEPAKPRKPRKKTS